MPRKKIAGVFASEEKLLSALRDARQKGLPVYDVYSPFPVHGMDELLGLPKSKLPAACFLLGLTGLILAFGFQEWAFDYSWPMNIGGKPYNSWPAYMPVTFELTVLFAGVGSVLVFLLWCGLNPERRPAFQGLGATDDKFILALESKKGSDEEKETLGRFLKTQGAVDVREEEKR